MPSLRVIRIARLISSRTGSVKQTWPRLYRCTVAAHYAHLFSRIALRKGPLLYQRWPCICIARSGIFPSSARVSWASNYRRCSGRVGVWRSARKPIRPESRNIGGISRAISWVRFLSVTVNRKYQISLSVATFKAFVFLFVQNVVQRSFADRYSRHLGNVGNAHPACSFANVDVRLVYVTHTTSVTQRFTIKASSVFPRRYK